MAGIAGSVAPVFRDEGYVENATYDFYHAIIHNNKLYFCRQDGTIGHEPQETSDEYWFLSLDGKFADSAMLGGETAEQWQEKINNITNGTTPVGNALKLNGYGANDFVRGVSPYFTEGETILDWANNPNGVYKKSIIEYYGYPSDAPLQVEGWCELLTDQNEARKVVRFTQYGSDSSLLTYERSIWNDAWRGNGWTKKNDGGNADTVGGKHASEFALLTDILSNGLLDPYLDNVSITDTFTLNDLLSRNTVTFFTNWSDSTNFPFIYASGVMIPCKDGSLKTILYARAFPDDDTSRFVVGYAKKNNGIWSVTWSEKADKDKVLPLTGGTLSGQNLFMNSGTGLLRADGNQTQLRAYSTAKDDNNCRALSVISKAYTDNVNNAVTLHDVINGVLTNYTVLHTGNFPVEEGRFNLTKSDGTIVLSNVGYYKIGRLVIIQHADNVKAWVTVDETIYGLPFPAKNGLNVVAWFGSDTSWLPINTQVSNAISFYGSETTFRPTGGSWEEGMPAILFMMYLTNE